MRLNEAVLILANKVEFGDDIAYTNEEVKTAIFIARDHVAHSYNEAIDYDKKQKSVHDRFCENPSAFRKETSHYDFDNNSYIDNENVLHFDNGKVYKLSLWDRFRLFFYFIKFEELEKKKKSKVTLG
jgi:hypothetical protein